MKKLLESRNGGGLGDGAMVVDGAIADAVDEQGLVEDGITGRLLKVGSWRRALRFS
jgi:hypothetical protein